MAKYGGTGFGLWGGRSRRLEYWLEVVALFAIPLLWRSVGANAIATIALLVGWMLVYGRRLHDIDRSAWWGLAALAVIDAPFAIGVVAGGAAFQHSVAGLEHGDNLQMTSGLAVAAIVAALFQVGFTLWLGVIRPQATANAFGPGPGGAKSAANVRPAVLDLEPEKSA